LKGKDIAYVLSNFASRGCLVFLEACDLGKDIVSRRVQQTLTKVSSIYWMKCVKESDLICIKNRILCLDAVS